MIKNTLPFIAVASVVWGGSLSTVAENAGTQLTRLQLPVMINQTGTYVDAQMNMMVYPGDRLMAMGGGSATVVYANGCEQTVSDNEIAQVGTPESCKTLTEAGTNFQIGAGAGAGTTATAGGTAATTATTAATTAATTTAATTAAPTTAAPATAAATGATVAGVGLGTIGLAAAAVAATVVVADTVVEAVEDEDNDPISGEA